MHASQKPPTAQLDHLVVLASTLTEGVRWCESVLGVTPGPGGEHALMGTHNRLLSVASPTYPLAMDSPEIQRQLQKTGPQLAHFVARTDAAIAGVNALARLGLDRGALLQASRMTPQGLLQWKITVRDDGERLLSGTLPTLIEWGDVHPVQAITPSGLALVSVAAHHPHPELLHAAYQAIGLTGVAIDEGEPNLLATLQTPRGLVTLESKGL